jgi:peptide/nickel transport system ATP-binding protein
LEVKDLTVQFDLDEGVLKAVDGVSFTLNKGEVLGLVGESGCGKSVTAQSILGLIPKPGRVGGSIIHHGEHTVDIVALNPKREQINTIRGKQISMIFQEPMTSFSPHYTIGNQIMETIKLHTDRNAEETREWAIEMLSKVGIANPQKRIDEYPHEFSGGMRQRAMIAMALACQPSLIIADEPTTALDVTIQAQVLRLMNQLKDETGASILFITHDLAVVAQMCDEVAVMYLGKIVEYSPVRTIFKNPAHPYTIGLQDSIPKVGAQAKEHLIPIEGTVPVPINMPERCGFSDRCKWAEHGLCDAEVPPLEKIEDGHWVRCFKAESVKKTARKE